MDDTRALLVQRRRRSEPDLLDEFQALASTAGYTVVGRFDIVGGPHSRFGISSGKVDEIRIWIDANDVDVVLFSPGLLSSQMFRLIEAWKTEVRDRAQLVLEIFDKHAQTVQAKLQIEHARLRYELPFIKHQLRMRLQREHTGARPVGEQIGAGEDLLNLRMIEIRRRIALINSKLEEISRSQELVRKRRSDKGVFEVTIAGYTNAGKSTLHNALTGSGVEIADQLFTTLATKSSEIRVHGRRLVISDSVGFISDLPSALLKAFNTTLMELADTDLILLVVDGSDQPSEIRRKTLSCLDTFRNIGVNSFAIVAALNKTDLIRPQELAERVSALQELVSCVVPISAAKRTNLEELLDAIDRNLPVMSPYALLLPYGDLSMSLLSWIHHVGLVESESYAEDGIQVIARFDQASAERLVKILPAGSVRRVTQE
ncbi:MAG: GTPase HflX [Candidatus Thorarchaeota archaeon]|nr:GTPase HflX [Candidatus Thorarchaeota archaeon]